jgi:uncharacterized membrane protein
LNPLNSVRGTIIAGVVIAVVIALLSMGVRFNVNSFIMWIHVLAGITWIGLLYYFNFVQVPALAEAAADQGGPGGAGITKYVAPRALAWFRWGAVVTWLAGAAFLAHRGDFIGAFTLGLVPGGGDPTYQFMIGVGAWLGTIMFINVWGVIWPNQKKVLGLVEASAEEINRARRVAFLASRTNVMLSIPMIMSMVAPGHLGFFL